MLAPVWLIYVDGVAFIYVFFIFFTAWLNMAKSPPVCVAEKCQGWYTIAARVRVKHQPDVISSWAAAAAAAASVKRTPPCLVVSLSKGLTFVPRGYGDDGLSKILWSTVCVWSLKWKQRLFFNHTAFCRLFCSCIVLFIKVMLYTRQIVLWSLVQFFEFAPEFVLQFAGYLCQKRKKKVADECRNFKMTHFRYCNVSFLVNVSFSETIFHSCRCADSCADVQTDKMCRQLTFNNYCNKQTWLNHRLQSELMRL